jgi:hypothetical protein
MAWTGEKHVATCVSATVARWRLTGYAGILGHESSLLKNFLLVLELIPSSAPKTTSALTPPLAALHSCRFPPQRGARLAIAIAQRSGRARARPPSQLRQVDGGFGAAVRVHAVPEGLNAGGDGVEIVSHGQDHLRDAGAAGLSATRSQRKKRKTRYAAS